MSIQIMNPKAGQATHTSRNRAEYLVRTGQAEMVDGQLRITVRPKQGMDVNHVVVGIAVVDRWTFPHTQWFTGETWA